MICVVCRQGEPAPGVTTATFQQDGVTVVISGVPARLCPQCGERYYDEATTDRLLAIVREAAKPGLKLEVREYAAA